MRTDTLHSLKRVAALDWDALVPEHNPFLLHSFLSALEVNDCVGEAAGWLPYHIVCYDEDERLVGAVPLYLKDNSYGEFVFDWGWADAYQRHGIAYYPKLVSAIPFTPATGPRLLVSPSAERKRVAAAMIERMYREAEREACSSIHWLFTTEADDQSLTDRGYMTRTGCQFHWRNADYETFDDFLAALNNKKRKNIRRERRLVQNADVELQALTGDQVKEADWCDFYRFYEATFFKRGRYPYMTRDFFLNIAESMGERILLVLAAVDKRNVAAAISFQSDTALYGRHWGCHEDYDSLHFEACYYQGIEYCIERGLQLFEPGAQGEHKIWRGFLPTITRSTHWLAHPAFSDAIADFLRRETPAVQEYARELGEHSPFRNA